jgi:hypothetical protein
MRDEHGYAVRSGCDSLQLRVGIHGESSGAVLFRFQLGRTMLVSLILVCASSGSLGAMWPHAHSAFGTEALLVGCHKVLLEEGGIDDSGLIRQLLEIDSSRYARSMA